MGTTAQKLQRVLDTKEGLKDTINTYLGQDITSAIPFKDYETYIKNFYNNLPKTSYAEGSNITLSNTLKGKLDFENDIVGYGDIKQEGTPTPDSPQEIEVVRGKNRWGGILYNGQVLGDGSINTSIQTRITNVQTTTGSTTYLEKGTYTISANNLDFTTLMTKNASGTILDNFTSAWHELPYTFTLTQSGYLYFSLRNSNNTNLTPSDYNVQIEKGSQATSYLPYNTLEIEERGANVFDGEMEEGAINGASGVPNTSTTAIRSKNYTNVSNIRKIAILGNDGTTKTKVIFAYDKDNHYLGNATVSNNNIFDLDTITLGNQTSYYSSNADIYNLKFVVANTTDLTINYGILDNSTTYEQYKKPKTYQLSLGEYIFARIGNYVDTIEYDVDEDKVYKNKAINKKTFIGASDENWELDTGYERAYNTDISNLVLKPSSNDEKLSGISDKLIVETFTDIYINKKQGLACSTGGVISVHIDNITDTFISASQFKTWLASNPITLYYALAEAVKEEITGTLKDQIKALYYSQSFTGTTIIEIDGQLPLIIKVRALKGE